MLQCGKHLPALTSNDMLGKLLPLHSKDIITIITIASTFPVTDILEVEKSHRSLLQKMDRTDQRMET